MEPLLYIMAIMGCGESDAACRQVAVVEQRYASEEQCLAAPERAAAGEEFAKRFDRNAAQGGWRRRGRLDGVAEIPRIGEALARVPETYRDVLVLYYREQRSIRDVARALEISEAAAATLDAKLIAEIAQHEGVFVPRNVPYWFESVGDEARGLEELVPVRVALREDALRQAVRGEDDVGVGAAHRPHLVQHHGDPGLRDLPGRFRTGQTATDHMNRRHRHALPTSNCRRPSRAGPCTARLAHGTVSRQKEAGRLRLGTSERYDQVFSQ